MKATVYVFVTNDGQFYGNRDSARIPIGARSGSLYDDFNKAMLFTSEEYAIEYRGKITNTTISNRMKLMPLEVEFTKAEMFKAILTGR